MYNQKSKLKSTIPIEIKLSKSLECSLNNLIAETTQTNLLLKTILIKLCEGDDLKVTKCDMKKVLNTFKTELNNLEDEESSVSK